MIGYFFMILVGLTLAISAGWAFSYFGLSCFEQIIFHLKVPLEGTNKQFMVDWLKKCFMKACLISLILLIPNVNDTYARYFPLAAICILIVCILYGAAKVGIFGFIVNQFKKSDLYEKYYVDGRDVKITFPSKKRNLILLYVESLETTYSSKDKGGDYKEDLIPEISTLAQENLNFSHQKQLGGYHVVAGTGWTTGGIVASTSGIPLTVPLTTHRFSEGKPFLPKAYALGDILENEGYQQEYLIGSDALFGGRKFYFDTHGHYRIFDLKEAYKEKKLPSDYHVFWGYEDEKLFAFAKEEILRLANDDQPFNFTMLTVDTHHPYGYKDRQYKEEYPEQLSNIIRGSSKKIGEFIDWLKQQPFYEDTTIVIMGDHTSMAAEYIHKTYDSDYDRTVMNVWIHAQKETTSDHDRIFTAFDIYPTILNAMGVEIENDKLGLGVSLFSGRKTLAEELGLKKLDQQLRMQSNYFKDKILK